MYIPIDESLQGFLFIRGIFQYWIPIISAFVANPNLLDIFFPQEI